MTVNSVAVDEYSMGYMMGVPATLVMMVEDGGGTE